MGKFATAALYLVLAIGVVLAIALWSGDAPSQTVPYSELAGVLKSGNIDEVTVTGTTLDVRLKTPDSAGRKVLHIHRVDQAMAEELTKYAVRFNGAAEQSVLPNILSWLLPMALMIWVWTSLFKSAAGRQGLGGGLLGVGKSKARLYAEKDISTSLKDVAGVDEAKEELQEVVAFLRDPAGHGRLGARMPKGILLVGPPGTGKTLLARAVAGEAAVPFFSINGSEFVEMFVGVGAARVRDLFEQAHRCAPCIVFIDELDALGRARGFGPLTGAHDEKEQTLNQLLSEMDGFDPRQGVILLAATNRPEILDPALLRAGRFDRQVLVGRPERAGRLAILKIHVAKVKLAPGTDLDQVAALTVGFTGADLANLANEAALAATRRGAPEIGLVDFTTAFERIVGGLEKRTRVLNRMERQITAIHELGHAFVALALPGSDTVHKVSIIPRGIGALGYTMQRPTEDRFLMRQEELENKLTVLLGGRAAEILVFGKNSTGAADDLAKATDLARSMVMQYGMDQQLGQVAYEPKRLHFLDEAHLARPREFSEQTAHEIDQAIRRLIADAFETATKILTEHRAALERAACVLLDRETVQEAELKALFTAPES